MSNRIIAIDVCEFVYLGFLEYIGQIRMDRHPIQFVSKNAIDDPFVGDISFIHPDVPSSYRLRVVREWTAYSHGYKYAICSL